VCAVISFTSELGPRLDELDINPLIAHPDGCSAADVLLRLDENTL
jgi:hypothetical protein